MESITDKLRSPLVATAALLAAGALFTGVIIMAYPSGNKDQQEIPIVKADLRPIKSEPDEPGGMDVPFQDSTVLSSIGEKQPLEEGPHIENLLAQANEDLTSKEEALQQAMSENMETDPNGEMVVASAEEDEDVPHERGMFLESSDKAPAELQAAQDIEEPKAPNFDIGSPDSSSILQKLDPEQAAALSAETSEKVASTAAGAKPKMHAAATSPETIDYVRSVLNENEPAAAEQAAQPLKEVVSSEDIAPSEEEAAIEAPSNPEFEQAFNTPQETPIEAPAEIEPAAGVAVPAMKAIEPGSYYVQLASITDQGRAGSEYAKLQKKFSVLSGLKYRVEEANLDKGTFYRIQAGPFSKDSAKSICDSIKAEKPGGCIIVK